MFNGLAQLLMVEFLSQQEVWIPSLPTGLPLPQGPVIVQSSKYVLDLICVLDVSPYNPLDFFSFADMSEFR